jgi:hypothetical protein
MTTPVYTFTTTAHPDDVQDAIDQPNEGGDPGYLVAEIDPGDCRSFAAVAPGDGAVIDLADPGDKTCWIGDVVEVEHAHDGRVLRVQIRVR